MTNGKAPTQLIQVNEAPSDAVCIALFRNCRPHISEYKPVGEMEVLEAPGRTMIWEGMPFETARTALFVHDAGGATMDQAALAAYRDRFRAEEVSRAREAYRKGWILELLNPRFASSRLRESATF